MGQSLKKLAPGSEGTKEKVVGEIAERHYENKFKDKSKEWTSADFYTAVCEVVEEVNRKFGNTQFRVPDNETLREAFEKDHKDKTKSMTKEEFQSILQHLVIKTGFTGIGAKDILLYIFGVPITTLFIKQRLSPNAIPNEIFIPAITSATVLVLGGLNKI